MSDEFYRDKMERLEQESEDQLVQEAFDVGGRAERKRCVSILVGMAVKARRKWRETGEYENYGPASNYFIRKRAGYLSSFKRLMDAAREVKYPNGRVL